MNDLPQIRRKNKNEEQSVREYERTFMDKYLRKEK